MHLLMIVQVKRETSGDDTELSNTGMAAVMAKILGKPVPKDRPTIMSKAITEKQLASRKRKHEENSSVSRASLWLYTRDCDYLIRVTVRLWKASALCAAAMLCSKKNSPAFLCDAEVVV